MWSAEGFAFRVNRQRTRITAFAIVHGSPRLPFVLRESDGLGLRESYGACWVSSGGGEIGWFIVRQGPPRAGVRVTRM